MQALILARLLGQHISMEDINVWLSLVLRAFLVQIWCFMFSLLLVLNVCATSRQRLVCNQHLGANV
jgi:hypothetical protein